MLEKFDLQSALFVARRQPVQFLLAICADTKLVPSWLVATRDTECAIRFIGDLASRLAHRVQLTSDGYRPYLEAVEHMFGGEIDYAQLIKTYGPTEEGERRYSPPAFVKRAAPSGGLPPT